MIEFARRRRPLHALFTFAVHRHVVVAARIRLPIRMDLRVERPVRHIQATDRISERAFVQVVRREPLTPIPRPHQFARLGFVDGERQERLRRKRLFDFCVGHQLRRPAELASLADTRRIEHGNRAAALASNRYSRGLPATPRIGNVAEGLRKIVFDDDRLGAARLQFGGRLGAAKWTNEGALRRIPDRFGAAGRAGKLLPRGHGRIRRSGPSGSGCDISQGNPSAPDG